MDRWHSIAEEKIREAMDAGQFRRLRGQGRPQDLRRNPYEPAELRMAHLVLEGAGLSPAWIEERKDLDVDVESVRKQLLDGWRAGDGEAAIEAFRTAAVELNNRILTYN